MMFRMEKNILTKEMPQKQTSLEQSDDYSFLKHFFSGSYVSVTENKKVCKTQATALGTPRIVGEFYT